MESNMGAAGDLWLCVAAAAAAAAAVVEAVAGSTRELCAACGLGFLFADLGSRL